MCHCWKRILDKTDDSSHTINIGIIETTKLESWLHLYKLREISAVSYFDNQFSCLLKG